MRHPSSGPRLAIAIALLACASAVQAEASAHTAPVGLATARDYIVGFVQYVRWPAEDAIQSWQVCTVSPLGDDIAAAYAGHVARGKAFSVRAVSTKESLAECHVLDLTSASTAETKALLIRARRYAILTVGDGERFCSAGGVVCLRLHREGGGFEINLSAAQQARLSVDAQLLMLGRKRQMAGSAP